MNKLLLSMLIWALSWIGLNAQTTTYHFYPDNSFKNEAIVKTMEDNLSKVLTEINTAYANHRNLNIADLPMTKDAQNTLSALWATSLFKTFDDYPFGHLWNYSKGYEARAISLLLTPRDDSGRQDILQYANVEFDVHGTITGFWFTAFPEGLDMGGEVVSKEREHIIFKFCNRLCTAYNTKDIDFIEKAFADDAVIITGSVRFEKYDGKTIKNVSHKKQNKSEYIANLRRVFERNEWIEVKFDSIGRGSSVVQSTENPDHYGVRLKQNWRSSTYHPKDPEVGYVFLLWDFKDEEKPVIHVRTWQSEYMFDSNKKIEEQIFSMEDFE